MQSTTAYTYPEHLYFPRQPKSCTLPVDSKRKWEDGARYTSTLSKVRKGYKVVLSREEFQRIAAKACYHCAVCPAGYVTPKSKTAVLDVANAAPACYSCRRLHVEGRLNGDQYSFSRAKRQRTRKMTVIVFQ
jgi:hypothetical protein